MKVKGYSNTLHCGSENVHSFLHYLFIVCNLCVQFLSHSSDLPVLLLNQTSSFLLYTLLYNCFLSSWQTLTCKPTPYRPMFMPYGKCYKTAALEEEINEPVDTRRQRKTKLSRWERWAMNWSFVTCTVSEIKHSKNQILGNRCKWHIQETWLADL